MTIVDYGCGPGRYTASFARLVGEGGRVYAVDIHELAIEATKRRIEKQGLKNVIPVLAQGYNSGVPDAVAGIVFAIDIFFLIKDPTAFLEELRRITSAKGFLVIDYGPQPPRKAERKIIGSRWLDSLGVAGFDRWDSVPDLPKGCGCTAS